MKIKLVIFVAIILLTACDLKRETKLAGHTMGTTYHITLITGYFFRVETLKAAIDERLEEINQAMSTFRPDSEISLFNASQPSKKFVISDDFFQVMQIAQKIYKITAGAWDGTVNPLLVLWGFTGTEPNDLPRDSKIKTALDLVGFKHIEITHQYLRKHKPGLTLDLGSIAKGYGVDQIAVLLADRGIDNFLVEIGGEVYAAGLRKDGGLWRIGINTPDKKAAYGDIYKVVTIKDRGFATSGDYRNFFEIQGKFYSHVISPFNGRPVTNGVVSASVMAANCTLADGLATALMVMGPVKGLQLIDRLAQVECMLVVQKTDSNLKDYYSKGFHK